jgi:hypothetical protein
MQVQLTAVYQKFAQIDNPHSFYCARYFRGAVYAIEPFSPRLWQHAIASQKSRIRSPFFTALPSFPEGSRESLSGAVQAGLESRD